MLEHLASALLLFLTPVGFGFCLLGVTLGVVVGVIPGISGAMLISLALPLTLYIDTQLAMVLLVAMYVGSVSGGLITATLLRIPGTPGAVMTTFDAYPMAQAGQPVRALALGTGASLIGGIISWLFLLLLSPPLARWSVNFGPWEFFTLMMMALVLISAISQGSMLKGLIAGFLGILASLPGIDAASGVPRLTFGSNDMNAGFYILPVLLGVFALGQVLHDSVGRDRPIERIKVKQWVHFEPLSVWFSQTVNLVRSSLIGTFVGILPGIGASIAAILSYSVARNFSRRPEDFGKGSVEGIVAAESANNASVGGALVPLVALGIPGSVIDAILLAALVMHGVSPGPMLYTSNPGLVYAIIATCLVATIMMFLLMSGAAGLLARVVNVPRHILFPVIIVACVIGAFASGNKLFDVWVMLGFGLVGFLMIRTGLPLGPFVIGFILAPKAEFAFRAAFQTSGGSLLPLLQRPIALAFLVTMLVLLFLPLLRAALKRQRVASLKNGN